MGYRTIIARYVAKWGIAQMCLCETKYQGGGILPFWGSANLLEKVSRDMGYRSDSIAVSRDMGPLSLYNIIHFQKFCWLCNAENLMVLFREYCFGREKSLSSANISVSSLWQTIIGWEELAEFSCGNSVRATKLTQFGVWSRTLFLGPICPRSRLSWAQVSCRSGATSTREWLWCKGDM